MCNHPPLSCVHCPAESLCADLALVSTAATVMNCSAVYHYALDVQLKRGGEPPKNPTVHM